MAEHDIDPRFERHVADTLRTYAEQGVQPFDAVEIAHNAARGDRRGRGRAPASGLPGALRLAVLSSAAVVLLAATALAVSWLRLPEPEVGPSPTLAAVLPPEVSPGSRTLPPVVDPELTPDPDLSPHPDTPPDPNMTSGPFTPLPRPTDVAAGPDDTPLPEPTGAAAGPDVTPRPEPTDMAAGPPATSSPQPATSPAGATVIRVAAGDLHFCALPSDRTIVCWGENSEGELGDGTTTDRWSAEVAVAGIDDAREIAAGTRFSCAVRADGSVWCWGAGNQGGSGSAIPERVRGIDDAQAVTAGAAHACALRSNGRVTCWGLGQLGQLGNGTIVHNTGNPPVAVSGLEDVQQLSAGWNHTCALRSDATVWCWGGNGDGATGYGQIGDGTYDNAPAPVQVQGLEGATFVAAGGWTSCAIVSDGSVWCWGYGERGGLGDGRGESSPLPVQVAGIDNARAVDVGGWHACALRGGGRVSCWGANDGQLGDGSRVDRFTPVAVRGLRNVTRLSAGWIDTCALRRDGTLWCWGSNHGPTPTEQIVAAP